MAALHALFFVLVFIFAPLNTDGMGLSPVQTDKLRKELQQVAQNISDSISGNGVALSVHHAAFQPMTLAVAAGSINPRAPAERLKPDDRFAWGSVVKTFTGASIMRLVSEGKLSLEDKAYTFVDPMLRRERYAYGTMERLFGSRRWGHHAKKQSFDPNNITIRHLLGMRSGVPDYDTDAYKHLQFAHPTIDFSPLDIFDFVHGPLEYLPGNSTSYCSVNFMLLGYVAAYFQNISTWRDLDQTTILPSNVQPAIPGSQGGDGVVFADKDVCLKYTRVHGITTIPSVDSNGNPSNKSWDVSSTSCVAGWTAGNVLMTVSDAARWTYALYGPNPTVLPTPIRNLMLPSPEQPFYGLATFNLSGMNGFNGSGAVSYGHLGDTYGFTSIIAFFPELNLSLAVATNFEKGGQDGPMRAICESYYRVANALGRADGISTCTFEKGSYYRGVCKCL